METSANRSTGNVKYYCHMCNTTIMNTITDFLCPSCNQGFVEKVSDGSSTSSSYTDRNSENGDEFAIFPAGLDNFLSNISNRVEVLLNPEGAAQNATSDGGSTSSSNQPSSPAGRGNHRRRTRIDSYNLNPERILTEFFNMTSRNGNDNGQVFLVSNPGDYAWGREGLDTIVTQLLNQMDSSGPPPLASDKIQELPFVKITEQQVSENVQCSVCWDSFRPADNVRQLPCEHIYHDPCIVPWLQLHGTCPICRKLLCEEGESRLGGFAQNGSLEALLSDAAGRLSIGRRWNVRCYNCNELGHYARECPARSRRNRDRVLRGSHRRAGEWGSNSYETNWTNPWNGGETSGWGTASAPAETGDGWAAPTSTAAGGAPDQPATNFNEGWGGEITVSDREWPVGEHTTSFEFSFDIPDDVPEWSGLDDECPSCSFSGDEDDDDEDLMMFERFNFCTNDDDGGGGGGGGANSSSTSFTTGNRDSRNTFRCFNCNEVGHVARKCPSKSKKPNDERGRKRVRCDLCSRYGHESTRCWNLPRTVARHGRNRPSSFLNVVSNRPPTPGRAYYNRSAVNGSSDRSSQQSSASGGYRNNSVSQSSLAAAAAVPKRGYRDRQRGDSHSFNRNAASSDTSFSVPSTSHHKQTFVGGVTCYSCKGQGHIARNCPTPMTTLPTALKCYKCGRLGHKARDCCSASSNWAQDSLNILRGNMSGGSSSSTSSSNGSSGSSFTSPFIDFD